MGTVAAGNGLYNSATSRMYSQPSASITEILDDWERRQKRIDRERDGRPVLLDGRRIDRARSVKGMVTV